MNAWVGDEDGESVSSDGAGEGKGLGGEEGLSVSSDGAGEGNGLGGEEGMSVSCDGSAEGMRVGSGGACVGGELGASVVTGVG